MSIIAGLQQAPGQAMPMGMGQPPMPGMKPPMGGAPTGITSDNPKQLAKLNEQMLLQLFNLSMMGRIKNPQPISVLGAISLKNKQKAAEEAVRNQILQGQNAQNQQSGTVAQQELTQLQAAMQPQGAMQPVMARHGGAMHGYNRGGIVGYANGTPPEGATSYPVEEQPLVQTQETKDRKAIISALEQAGMGAAKLAAAGYDVATLPVRALAGIYNTIIRAPRAFGIDVPFIPKEFGQDSLTPMMDRIRRKEQAEIDQVEAEAMGVGLPSMTQEAARVDVTQGPLPTPTPTPEVRPPPAPSAPQVKPPPTEAQTQRPQVRPPAAVAKPDDLETLGKTLRNAGKMTPELEKVLRDARAKEMEIRRAALMGQESRAKEDYNRAKQRLEQELSKDRGIFSARGLATLAASISTEPGKVFRSLGEGLEKVYAGEEAARSQARSNYDIARAAFRKEQNLMDERRVLIQERNTAIAERRVEQAMQAQQRLAEIDQEIYKLREERENASFTRETQRISAEAQRTQAGRKSETEHQERIAKGDPALYNQMYGKRLDPYQKAQLMDKASSNVLKDDKQLPVKISNAKAAAAKAGRPFDEQAFVDSLVNAEYERLIAAGEDRPIKSETPAAGQKVIDFASIGAK